MHRWLLGALLLIGTSVAAQTNTGQISGTVRDGSGGVLPGVTVTITNVNTAAARTEVTGPNGTYVVTSLPVGTYTVTASAHGYGSQS